MEKGVSCLAGTPFFVPKDMLKYREKGKKKCLT